MGNTLIGAFIQTPPTTRKLPLHGWEGCITDLLQEAFDLQLQYVVGPLSIFILLAPEQASSQKSSCQVCAQYC